MPQKSNICTVMHQHFLRQALLLAQQRRGFCAPNPAVGAILVNAEHDIIAQANHHAHGAPHAELAVLQQAGDQARGATLYVTLPTLFWLAASVVLLLSLCSPQMTTR